MLKALSKRALSKTKRIYPQPDEIFTLSALRTLRKETEKWTVSQF